MIVTLRGTTREIRKYAEKLRAVGSDRVLRKLCDNVAVEGLDLIEEGFEAEQGPNGEKWRPKVFSDGRQVLVGNTTRLRRGWHRKWISATGFCLSPSVDYAKYQQGTGIYGPKHEPIRPKTKQALAFYAPGFVTRAAAGRVRYSAAAGYRGKAGQSVASRMAGMKRAGNSAVSKMKGSTLILRSVKGSPPRLMVPNTRKLPIKWARRFRAAAHDFLRNYFGGA